MNVVSVAALAAGFCVSLIAAPPPPSNRPDPSIAMPAAAPSGPGENANAAAWGTMVHRSAFIEVPVDTIRAMESWPAQPTWRFSTTNETEVENLLKESGLPADLLAVLADRRGWRKSSSDISIIPLPETVLDIPPSARERIYRHLGNNPGNVFYAEPLVVYGESVRHWLKGTPLREEIVAAVERTAYRRFDTLFFSDVALLYAMAKSDAERLTISKAISRTPALMPMLQLGADNDWRSIAQYWSAGYKRKDVGPMLESMSGCDSVGTLDIIHLLPPTPRKLLNTFAHPSQYIFFGQLPDCHWTSLNFFNYDPLPRLAEPAAAASYLDEHYAKVMPPLQFGDVIFFTNRDGSESHHSCVFVADDIVFTKNGRSVLRPWTLMLFKDVANIYRTSEKIHFTIYRRNTIAVD